MPVGQKFLLSVRGLALAALMMGAVGLSGCSGNAGGSTSTLPAAVVITGGSQVRLGSTVQFSANVPVTWQVNEITGGAAATGTISTTGLYTPPASIPVGTTTISAISVTLGPATASQAMSILNPTPVVALAAVTQNFTGPNYLVDVMGTGFISSSVIQIAGANVTTIFVSATELQATITTIPLTTGTTTVAVDVVNPNPGTTSSVAANVAVTALKASQASAARLLDQATFGPTLNDIQHVQTVGLSAYLTEQFAVPVTVLPDIATPTPTICVNSTIPCEQSEWWQTVLTGNDQLRQRVAFAMSEVFVISTNSVNARAVTTFHNTLANDAFGNFKTLMKDVTLSPGMGLYLNMLNSYKPGNGQIANENYSRELMQLFITGIYLLNQDGTYQKDSSGNLIPVYSEAQVQAFARAYTGWTYAPAAGVMSKFPNAANYTAAMAAIDSAHDVTAKTLLNGTTLPAGQTSVADLDGAISNLFTHPNVGPFICKQLIQHLVASNPSPAYVSRVAAVFADNGKSVRGDMQAVIAAILLDADARASDTITSFDGGHLRESMLYMTNVMRGLGFKNNDATAGNDVVANASYNSVGNYTTGLGQRPYSSASVFNFFSPQYVIPGSTTNAPEFGQENTATAILRLTLADNLVSNRISGFTVDLSATSALGIMASKTGNAATDSGNLVDALGTIFMHGQMPAAMRTPIVTHVATLTNIPQRVRVATYLVISASQYKIEH